MFASLCSAESVSTSPNFVDGNAYAAFINAWGELIKTEIPIVLHFCDHVMSHLSLTGKRRYATVAAADIATDGHILDLYIFGYAETKPNIVRYWELEQSRAWIVWTRDSADNFFPTRENRPSSEGLARDTRRHAHRRAKELTAFPTDRRRLYQPPSK